MTKAELLKVLTEMLRTLNKEQLKLIYHIVIGLRAGEGRRAKSIRIGNPSD